MRCRYGKCKTCNKECNHYKNIGGIILCDYLKQFLGNYKQDFMR